MYINEPIQPKLMLKETPSHHTFNRTPIRKTYSFRLASRPKIDQLLISPNQQESPVTPCIPVIWPSSSLHPTSASFIKTSAVRNRHQVFNHSSEGSYRLESKHATNPRTNHSHFFSQFISATTNTPTPCNYMQSLSPHKNIRSDSDHSFSNQTKPLLDFISRLNQPTPQQHQQNIQSYQSIQWVDSPARTLPIVPLVNGINMLESINVEQKSTNCQLVINRSPSLPIVQHSTPQPFEFNITDKNQDVGLSYQQPHQIGFIHTDEMMDKCLTENNHSVAKEDPVLTSGDYNLVDQVPKVSFGRFSVVETRRVPCQATITQHDGGMVTGNQLAAANGGVFPLKLVSELPNQFHSIFPFPCFNRVQSKCFADLINFDTNVVVSSPTGSGKTAILDLALIRLWMTKPKGRAVYLAPTKALCSERTADWTQRLSPLGIQVAGLTGDTTLAESHGCQNARLLVVTSEKFDAVTRRWRESRRFVDELKLVLIDEVHMLCSSRGATLDAVIARLKLISSELGSKIRFVALSATFQNIDDVGIWLDHAKVHSFGEEYRPVQLERHVFGYPSQSKSLWGFEHTLNSRLPSVLQDHSNNRPSLVFCSTRKSTETTAKLLMTALSTSKNPFVQLSTHANILQEAANQCSTPGMHELLVHGVSFHHAGIGQEDRQLVEKLFREGYLSVLCTTSTLAMGVNLPAYLVVIKGTSIWESGRVSQYARVDVLQMIGRAGRPGLETSGKAVIMTQVENVEEFKSLINGCNTVESTMHKDLVQHLNAEIAHCTISSETDAITWLKSTFFYVRLNANPDHYSNVLQGIDDLSQLVMSSLAILFENKMIRYIQPFTWPPTPTSRLECSSLGCIMSRYCISLRTMQVLLGSGPSIPQQLYAIGMASDFSSMYVKAGDKATLARLNQMQGIKFPLPEAGNPKIKEPADKVYLIVQAVLGGVQLQGRDNDRLRMLVNCDSALIWPILSRVSSAMVDIQIVQYREMVHECAADGLFHAVHLLHSIRAKLWFDSDRVLRQLDKLGPVLTALLAEANIVSFSDMICTPAWRIEQIVRRNPPFGDTMIRLSKQAPQIDVAIGFDKPQQVCLTVGLSNSQTCNTIRYGMAMWVHVIVQECNGLLLFHDRLSLTSIAKMPAVICIPIPNTSSSQIFVSVLPQDYIGLDVNLNLDVQSKQTIRMKNWSFHKLAFSTVDLVSCYNIADIPRYTSQRQEGSVSIFETPILEEVSANLKSVSKPATKPIIAKATRPRTSKKHDGPCRHKCKNKKTCKHSCCKIQEYKAHDQPFDALKCVPLVPKLDIFSTGSSDPEPEVFFADGIHSESSAQSNNVVNISPQIVNGEKTVSSSWLESVECLTNVSSPIGGDATSLGSMPQSSERNNMTFLVGTKEGNHVESCQEQEQTSLFDLCDLPLPEVFQFSTSLIPKAFQ